MFSEFSEKCGSAGNGLKKRELVPTSNSDYDMGPKCCIVCHAAFRRLATHLLPTSFNVFSNTSSLALESEIRSTSRRSTRFGCPYISC